MKTKKFRCERKYGDGFTLIEIMAVVVILGILAVVVISAVSDRVLDARIATAKAHIAQIEESVQMFYMDNGKYPGSIDALASGSGSSKKTYLKIVPRDPWKNAYFYTVPGPGNHPYDVGCYGADGKSGGDGGDADITCWTIHEK